MRSLITPKSCSYLKKWNLKGLSCWPKRLCLIVISELFASFLMWKCDPVCILSSWITLKSSFFIESDSFCRKLLLVFTQIEALECEMQEFDLQECFEMLFLGGVPTFTLLFSLNWMVFHNYWLSFSPLIACIFKRDDHCFVWLSI